MSEPIYAIPGTRIIGAKLSVGTTLRVHGWIMLKNLDEGDYVITSVGYFYNNPCYTFRKARGRKRVCCHFANDVDRCVRPAGDIDLNRIEILAVGERRPVEIPA
jgi:hypothetical protein